MNDRVRRIAPMLLIAIVALVVAGCGGRDDDDGGGSASDPGITKDEIHLGTPVPYSGPASAYGVVGEVAKAYAATVNVNGGINGRKLRFTTVDDAFDPTRAVTATRRLVERDKVFAIAMPVGTPTNLAIMKYLNQRKIPQLFVTTGSAVFGTDPTKNPWTIGFIPDYISEARAYAKHLETTRPHAKVGILYQNDGLGKDFLTGFDSGIESTDITVVDRQSYELTDASVASRVSRLKDAGADTLLLVTTPKFAAQALAAKQKLGWDPLTIVDSVSASPELVFKPAGLDAAKGVITAQFFKVPADPQFASDPDVKEYLAAMRKHAPKVNPNDPFAIMSWLEAWTLGETLRRMKEPTRAAAMASARNLDLEVPMLLPGIRVRTTPEDGYPLQQLQIARFDGQKFVLEGGVIDASGEPQ